MSLLLSPCLCTIAFILIEWFRKVKHPPTFYIRIFTIILGINLICDSCFADEISKENEHTICQMRNFECYNDHQLKQLKEKMLYHEKEGQKAFRNAEKQCVLIPDMTDREIARALFKSALFLSLEIGKSWVGVVTSLIYLLGEYAINSYDQWQLMESYLNQAKYHFEMRDFYKDALDRA